MANEWAKLIKVLEEEAELHGALIASVERKREMIVRNELQELESLEVSEERLAGRLRTADRLREEVSMVLAARLGLPPGEFKLARLAAKAPEPDRSRLQHVGDRLKGLVAELQKVNGELGEVLRHALTHIDAFFKLIADSLTQKPTYTPSSVRKAGTPAASVLDQQA